MIASKINSKTVLIGIILQAGLWIGFHLPVFFGSVHQIDDREAYFFAAVSSVGYILAFLLNLEIASEYKDNKLMRWSWYLIAANAGISVGREAVVSPLFNSIWSGYFNSDFAESHHGTIILIANSCLALGLLGMWRGYQKTGLGFGVKTVDYIEIALIAALTVGLLVTVERSPVGLIILSCAAAVSVVLYRMAAQMGGGKLALAIRCLTVYTLLRATLVLIESVTGLIDLERRQSHDLIISVDILIWRTVPWVAALAAAYRAELKVHASEELKKSENELVGVAA